MRPRPHGANFAYDLSRVRMDSPVWNPVSASNLLEAISAACVELSTSGTSIFPCRHLNECPSELSRTL